MTEAEAKTKWCCGPKIVADERIAFTLMQRNPPEPAPEDANGLCIASKCMAWRGHYEITKAGRRFIDDGHGYCGLAGKP